MADQTTTDGEQPAATTRVLDEAQLAELAGVDDDELAELGQDVLDQVAARRAKVAGDETGAGDPPAAEEHEEGSETEPAPEGAAGPKGKDRSGAIPRKRFDEVNQRLHEEREARRLLEERLAALEAGAGRQPQAEPAEEPQQDAKAPILAQLDELADRYDAGDLDRKAYDKQRRDLEEALFRLKLEEEGVLGEQQPAVTPAELVEQVRFQDEAERLDVENPWLKGLYPHELDLACAEAQRRHHERTGRDPGADIRAARAALPLALEVLEEVGYRQLGELRLSQQNGGKPATQPSPAPTPGKTPAPVPPTREQRQQKVALAKQTPPDLNGAPRGGTAYELTEEAIEKMSSRDLEALPTHVKKAAMRRLGLEE